MTNFPWHNIDSGDRFQDLIGCLLLQEVSKHVHVFTKAGRDYGIDASFEGEYDGIHGSWRFQCKHYSDMDNLKAELRGSKGKDGKITKGEVQRIIDHLASDPNSMGARLWTGTTQYRLIISLHLLPQQRQEIIDLLTPLVAHGISVDVWEGAKVELLCNSKPFVMAQMFGDHPPLFLPLAEFRRQQRRRPFGEFYDSLPYAGRDEITAHFEDFLKSDNAAFFITGTGGVGKTRTLMELACAHDDDLTIRAIQIESGHFEQHLTEIDDSQRHLLVLDEADRYTDLERVLWLATAHRRFGGRVRMLVACRGAVSRPVRASLERAFGANRVVLAELPRIEAVLPKLASQLGHTGDVARALIRLAEGVPLWLILASEAIGHGTLVEQLTKERIIKSHIDRYLDEVAPQEKELHRTLLDVLAAVEPINIRDPATRDSFAKLIGDNLPRVMRAVEDVLRSGFAEQRGRFLCIAPDLVADYLLVRAMFTESNLPTDRHRQMLDGPVPDMRRLITNLARAEYLSGELLLDEVVTTAIAPLDQFDTLQCQKFLNNFAALAYVRPEQFLTIVERMVAMSLAGNLRHEPELEIFGSSKSSFLDIVPPLLRPVLGHANLQARTLELLAIIAESQDFNDRAGFGAMRVFTDGVQYPEDGDTSFLWQALDVLRAWWASHQDRRLRMVLAGVARLLALEVQFSEVEGNNIVIKRGRPPLTDELRRLRAAALGLLQLILAHSSHAVRANAARVLRDAASEVRRARPRRQDSAEVQPTPPGEHPEVEVQSTPTEEYLDEELNRIFLVVEGVILIERAPHVVDCLIEVVHWDAEFASKSLFGKRATTLENEADSRPSYQLYALLAGARHDLQSEVLTASIISKLIAEGNPVALANELASIAGPAGSRGLSGGASFLLELGSRHPDYARSLLQLIDIDQSTLPMYWSASLVAGLRVSGDSGLISQFAKASLEKRKVAAIACTRLRPLWHPGFRLTNEDISVMRDLLDDPDEWLRRQLVEFVWTIVSDEPNACLALVEVVARKTPAPFVEQIAHVCREALKVLGDISLPQVSEIVECFRSVPNIEGHHANTLLADLARRDLDWFFNFLTSRVEYAASAGLELYNFSAVPADLSRFFTEKRFSPQLRADALKRALTWLDRTYGFTLELPRLVYAVAGGLVSPELVVAIRASISSKPTALVLAQIGRILHDFSNGEAKFILLGECLVATSRLQSDEQISVCDSLSGAIGRRSLKWSPGQTPPALLKLLDRLDELRKRHPDAILVQKFAEREMLRVQREIAEIRDRDAELYIE